MRTSRVGSGPRCHRLALMPKLRRHCSRAVGSSTFEEWVAETLTAETLEDQLSGGTLPDKPIKLTEVEALALMLMAFEAGTAETGSASVVAGRLAANLRYRLERFQLASSSSREQLSRTISKENL